MGRIALVAAMAALLVGCRSELEVDGWTVECQVVLEPDCTGVAALFVNNLARNGGWIRDESGGRVRVSPASCPADPHPDAVTYLDLGACWRADAPIPGSRACMLIARQKNPAAVGAPFGQAGGDNYTGLFGAPEPGSTPC